MAGADLDDVLRDYRAAFDARAVELEVEPHVLGPVDHDVLPGLVAGAAVLGFVSTNIFEAMSTATMVPIIVFSLDAPGGFRSILEGRGTYTRVHN